MIGNAVAGTGRKASSTSCERAVSSSLSLPLGGDSPGRDIDPRSVHRQASGRDRCGARSGAGWRPDSPRRLAHRPVERNRIDGHNGEYCNRRLTRSRHDVGRHDRRVDHRPSGRDQHYQYPAPAHLYDFQPGLAMGYRPRECADQRLRWQLGKHILYSRIAGHRNGRMGPSCATEPAA